jgi:O-antigen ligase
MAVTRARLWSWSALVIVGFVAYGLLDTALMGLLTRYTFAWYMRTFGLPMLMFLLLAQHGFGLRELRALVRSLLLLGAYMALVSIAERVGWYDLIVPTWISAPPPDVAGPSLASVLYPGRSGGVLMQPAWNGLALSLILCLAILSVRLSTGRSRWVGGVVGLLCLIGIFLSYTRAAWLACAFASLVLFWRPSATRAKTQLKRFGVVAASALLIVMLALLPGTTARQRIGDSGTVVFRLNLWEAGVGMVADRPLFGSGFGSFGGNIADYEQDMTVGAPTNFSASPSHNTLLNVLVELGVIGFLLYVGALVAMLRWARTAALQSWGREGGVWAVVFFGVYVIQAQFAFAHEPTTNQILFGVMGAVAGLLRLVPAVPRRASIVAHRSSTTPASLLTWGGVAATSVTYANE